MYGSFVMDHMTKLYKKKGVYAFVVHVQRVNICEEYL